MAKNDVYRLKATTKEEAAAEAPTAVKIARVKDGEGVAFIAFNTRPVFAKWAEDRPCEAGVYADKKVKEA